MKMLMKVTLPHETFNTAVRNGTAEAKTQAILDSMETEAIYFTEMDGCRTVIMIVEVESPSMVPPLAEPWFLTFNAKVEFHVVMSPEDLQKGGLESLGKKWG